LLRIFVLFARSEYVDELFGVGIPGEPLPFEILDQDCELKVGCLRASFAELAGYLQSRVGRSAAATEAGEQENRQDCASHECDSSVGPLQRVLVLLVSRSLDNPF